MFLFKKISRYCRFKRYSASFIDKIINRNYCLYLVIVPNIKKQFVFLFRMCDIDKHVRK